MVVIRLMVDGSAPNFYADKPYNLITAEGEVSLLNHWRLKRGCVMPKRPGETFIRWQPAGLYNNMIAPLGHYSIAGVLWYQGESNTGKSWEYFDLMSTLIEDWRKLWGREDLPFALVQLANDMGVKEQPSHSSWADLRAHKLKVSTQIPYTSLTVAIAVGVASDLPSCDTKRVGAC